MNKELLTRLKKLEQASGQVSGHPITIEIKGYDEPADYYTIENGKERLMTDDEVYKFQVSDTVMSDISITIGEWTD